QGAPERRCGPRGPRRRPGRDRRRDHRRHDREPSGQRPAGPGGLTQARPKRASDPRSGRNGRSTHTRRESKTCGPPRAGRGSQLGEQGTQMAELTIRPEEIRDALESFVQSYKPDAASREEVGTVTFTADGIARVEGLPSVMANELLKFEDGTLGLALNLDTREIGVVILGSFDG